MEIISGFAKNVQLKTPRSFNVRPTTIRARCALFDSLGSFEGLKVLDLFAGSGAMGLEAASRGASEVTLVESAPEHCRFIRTNVEKVEQLQYLLFHQHRVDLLLLLELLQVYLSGQQVLLLSFLKEQALS